MHIWFKANMPKTLTRAVDAPEGATAFQLGKLELPSFDVAVEDGERLLLPTDGWTVTVETVGLDEGGDIRDRITSYNVCYTKLLRESAARRLP